MFETSVANFQPSRKKFEALEKSLSPWRLPNGEPDEALVVKFEALGAKYKDMEAKFEALGAKF